MKSIGKIFLIVFGLLFTGCTINYNITVKSDSTIDEKISIVESNTTLKNSGYTIEEIVDSKITSYSSEIENNNFTYKTNIGKNNTKVVLSSKNKSMEEFIKFPYFTKMFNGADIIEDGNKYSFKTNGKYNQSGLFYDLSGIVDDGFVDTININIKFDDEVISTNADSYDESNNTYTWILDKNTNEKSIEYELLKNNSSSINNKVNKKIDLKKPLLLTGIIFVIIILLLLYVLTLYKKRNKL